MAQIFEYEDMFKWPGHKLSEAYIDFTFLMILGEYKIKNLEQELFKYLQNG